MQSSSYLESKVLTASPYRLHLMLIEGAIRFGRQAEDAMQRGDEVAASAPLLRVLDIVGEMLAGVRENRTDLTLKIAELYLFIFRRISEAKIHGNINALSESLRLLEFERQTWQMACEKVGRDAAAPRPMMPHLRSFDSTGASAANGVSWQA